MQFLTFTSVHRNVHQLRTALLDLLVINHSQHPSKVIITAHPWILDPLINTFPEAILITSRYYKLSENLYHLLHYLILVGNRELIPKMGNSASGVGAKHGVDSIFLTDWSRSRNRSQLFLTNRVRTGVGVNIFCLVKSEPESESRKLVWGQSRS